MTTGIQSSGVDLDDIFALYQSGTHPPATGILVNGTDIATRYQPLPGTAAAATSILTNGTDLNALFSTTAGPNESPENGKTFSASNVTASTGGTAVGILLTFTNATTYQFTGWQAQVLGTFTVPSGATKFTAVLTYVSGSTTAQTVEDTPTATAIASGVQLLDLNIGAYSGTPETRTCTYSCKTTWENAAGSIIATGTSTLNISSQLT